MTEEIVIETETSQLIKKQDLEEYHQGYFNNEFYEDCYIPHYWQNPFVNFLHSHGKAGTFDYFDAAVEYFEPKTGKNITIWFETATNGDFVNFISEIDDFENSIAFEIYSCSLSATQSDISIL